jgi:hypothetical protein
LFNGAAETKRVVADGKSRSNSYYVALGIRLIAKEPKKNAFDTK